MTRFLAAVAAWSLLACAIWADDPTIAPRGGLGSGAQLGQALKGLGGPQATPAGSGPLNQGLG